MSKKYASFIVGGAIFVFLSTIVITLINFVTRIFLARSLSVTDYGLVYAALSIVGIFNIVKNLGLLQTLQKKIPGLAAKKNYVKMKSFIYISLISQFFYFFVIFAAVVIFADTISLTLLKTREAIPLIILFSLATFISPFYQTIIAVFQGLKEIRITMYFDLFGSIFRLGFVFFFISLGSVVLPYSYIFSVIAGSILIFFIFKKKCFSIIEQKMIITKKDSLELFYFSFPIMVGSAAGVFMSYAETLFIAIFKNLEDVAIYQVGFPLADTLLFIGASVSFVLLPVISELHEMKNYKLLSRMVGLIFKITFIIILPFLFIFLTFPDVIINLLSGPKYAQAAVLLQIASFGSMFLSLAAIFSTVILGIGKPKINTKIAIFFLVFQFLLDILLIPKFSYIGAAISMVLTGFFVLLFLVLTTKKHIDFTISYKDMMKAIVSGIIAISVILLLKNSIESDPWIKIFIILPIAFTVYTIFIFLSGAVSREEIGVLFGLNLPIPKILKKTVYFLSR